MTNDGVFRKAFVLPPVALFSLFVGFVLTTTAAELTKFKPLRRRLLVLCRHVIAALTFGTLQHNIIARHKSPLCVLDLRFQIYILPTLVFPLVSS